MKKKRFVLSEEMLASYSTRMQNWFNLLNDIMPDYFFNTFTSEEIQDILPVLYNLKQDSGIQQIYRRNTIIFIYLKNEANNLVTTAKMVRNHDIEGACIHESKEKIVIDDTPSTLVIEYYKTKPTSTLNLSPLFTKKELTTACKKRFKTSTQAIHDLHDRINWNVVGDLDLDRLTDRLSYVLQAQAEDHIILNAEKVGKDEVRLTMALSNCPRKGFYFKYIQCLNQHGFHVQRAYLRKITFQDDENALAAMPVSVNTLYMKSEKNLNLNSRKFHEMLSDLAHIKWVPMDDLFHTELVEDKQWSLAKTNLMRAAGEFIHTQLAFVDRHAYNIMDIYRLMALYEPMLENLFCLFELRFAPMATDTASKQKRLERKIEKEIANINTGTHEKDVLVKTIFAALLNFFNHIRKSNYYHTPKTALSFRIDPAFMTFYDRNYSCYKNAFPAGRPYGIFYFYRDSGIGFHIRFSKIARGGWRTVIPKTQGHHLEQMDVYSFAKDEVYREVFVLAHTQHLKNKDIYEGGSKMICLLNQKDHDFYPFLYEIQRSIARAFIDLINYDNHARLKTADIKDLLAENEIIEIGPDENMYDTMINWLSSYAEKLGYCLGGGIISGKPDSGINHKEFGVTSYGVHQFLLKTLEELHINPNKDEFSVKISGGPFGDVAGNELKLLFEKAGKTDLFPKLRVVAITDGPAAAYDPDGLDRNELQKLIHTDNLDGFSPEKLKADGAYIVYSTPIMNGGNESYRYVYKKGGKIQEKQISRDEFMRLFQNNLLTNYADIFIPCGGRPATINESNWQDFCPNGIPSSKAIVEGANSFITPEAREKLQSCGIWIIKDASANKCGVITSSYEILSGLMLSKPDFKVKKPQLVAEIMAILQKRARKEADWLFNQFRTTGKPMTVLTEQLSHEINAKNVELYNYFQYHQELINDELIFAHLPETFALMGPEILNKIPIEYKEAIASVELACRIIYGRSKSLEDEIASVQ